MNPVDPARYRRVRALLHEAALLDTQARRPFLEREAAGDAGLAAEVLALLEHDAVPTHAVVPAAVPFAGAAPALAAGTALGPLEIVREIGRGGMGVVYEAVEKPSGRPVAVKVILPALIALPTMRERFAREARLGIAIDHENVVRTLSFGEATVDGRALHYLVMELVRGRTLRELLTSMGSVPEALWREIAVQAARGLAALHAAGVVHRDLKPENLLLSDDRRVRIMDLGVAKLAATGASLTTEGQFVGSLRYASPEQCAGKEIGPSSDLYGLGIALYELAAGRPPFALTEPVALLRAHVEAEPVPLAERNPAYSDFAGAVVATLLEKRPERRFASAASLVTALEEAESGSWFSNARRAPRRSAAPRAAAPALPLVGRGRERDALLEAWRAARRGEGAVALIEGEAGIGKTRLVEDLLQGMRDEHVEVLRSGFVPAGGSGRLEEALHTRLGDTGLEAEIARRLAIPADVASSFAAHLRSETPAPGSEPMRGERADALVARLARSLADDAPLVWLVEDLHFADAEARRRVVALGRAIQGHRALLLVTTRPGLDPATLAALSMLPGASRLDVPRLDEEGVRALASEALRDGALGRHFARELATRADGIPLFVLALLRDLERSGHLVRDAAGTLHEGRRLDEPHAPHALADLLRSRLSTLSTGERRILETAAVEGHEFDPGLVAKALALPRLEVLEALGRLERVEGLVRSGPRLCRFDHHLLQEVAYADLAPALRAELHARLADAIAADASQAEPRSEAAIRVARHRLRGPDPAGAAATALETARYAAQQGRFEEANDIVGRALSATRGQADSGRASLLLEAASLAVTTGRTAETPPLLDEARRIAEARNDVGLAARVRLQRGSNALEQGRYDVALSEAEAAEPGTRATGDAKGTFDALAMRGLALWSLGRTVEAVAAQERALAFAETLESPILLARAAADLAIVLQETGHHGRAEIHLRAALETLEGVGDRLNVSTVRMNLGNVLLGIGRLDEATQCYEVAIRESHERGQRHGEAGSWVNLGETRLRSGDFEGAREAFRLSEQLCRECGVPRTGAYATHGLGFVAHWSGDRVEARRRFEEALRVRRRLGAKPGIADSVLALAALDLEEGSLSTARTRLLEAKTLGDEVGDPNTSALSRLYEALLPGGDAAEARRAYEREGKRLYAPVQLEGAWILWRLSKDPKDLLAARALLDEQAQRLPKGARARYLERVPYARAVAEATA